MLRRTITQKKEYVPSIGGQTAIEYLLLLATTVAIVLLAFNVKLLNVHNATELFFNRSAAGIMGSQNPCGDGNCTTRSRLRRSGRGRCGT